MNARLRHALDLGGYTNEEIDEIIRKVEGFDYLIDAINCARSHIFTNEGENYATRLISEKVDIALGKKKIIPPFLRGPT
jgi:hypothetical protein